MQVSDKLVAGSQSGSAPGDPSCTVAILWSGRPSIVNTLKALLPQLVKQDEVLIVQTCADADASVLPQHDQIRIALFVEEIFDFGRARNFAVHEAHGEILAFTDDDCIPNHDWLASLRSRFVAQSIKHHVIGGATLPARQYKYPWWWSHDLDWAIGMSTPGMLRGEAGHYPAGSNLAAYRAVFLGFPFPERPRDNHGEELYYSGREDAEWWRTMRTNGILTEVLSSIIVQHDIPDNRVTFGYALSRSRADGVAYWRRRAGTEVAGLITREYVNSQIALLRSLAGFRPGNAIRDFLWMQRNRAARDEAVKAGAVKISELRNLQYHAGRQLAADAFYKFTSLVVKRVAEPPTGLNHLFISAQTFLGDTVLMRPHIAALARKMPGVSITVAATFPELLSGLPGNVTVLPDRETDAIANAAHKAQYAIMPYYPKGDPILWRRVLARKSVTFTSDVGFGSRREYLLAARHVPKDMRIHEMENLRTLFNVVAELPHDLAQPPYDFTAASEQVRQMAPFVGQQNYVVIQTTSGRAEKDWPLERWLELANRLVKAFDVCLVFLSSNEQRPLIEKGVTCASGRFSFLEEDIMSLGYVLSRCVLFVGPCSGPKHLAHALGKRTFTLYGPTEPERWGSPPGTNLGSYVRAIPDPLTTEEAIGLPEKHLIELITVDEVYEGVADLLKDGEN